MKKKLVLLLSTPFVTASTALAVDPSPSINIVPPQQGYQDIGRFITNIIQLSFIVGVLAVLFMLIWGAFEWITSGGDKDAIGKARGRIINALIGMAVLAVAFALFKIAGQFLGFETTNFTVPKPNP